MSASFQVLPVLRRRLRARSLAALGLLAAALPAFGQTVTTNGAYTVLRYNSSGTFTVPAGVTGVDYVIVGGGGGGGGNRGGGGGAGGVRTGSIAVTPGASYTVTIGAGGAAAASGSASSVAFPTVITAAGGGAGGHVGSGGGSGGSGGGAGGGTASPGGAGTSGQGSAGGGGSAAGSFGGAGGGGGFSAAGGTGISGSAAALTGTGGAGYTETLTGQNLGLAGGGGGGVQRSGDSTVGSAGATAFGGGNGSGANATAGSGVAGTGGGGGGGGSTVSGVGGTGGPGGSGTVILRYLTPAPVLTAVTIASSNANPARARTGDTVTVTFTADRALNPAAGATLRGWYPLDGTRTDPTLVGPTLTESPAAATFAAGLSGQAASFTGTGVQYLRAAINASGNTNPTFTWGAWVKVSDATVWSTPLSVDDNGWDRFLSIFSGFWAVSFNGHNLSPVAATTNWTFIAQTFDGTTQRLYVDTNPAFAAPDPGNQVMQPHIDIGRNANGATGFPGLIDGVFFFDDALTPAQIETIRAGGAGGSGVLRVAGRMVVASIAGRPAAVTLVSGNTWRATQTLLATDPVGTVPFTLNFADTDGVAGVAVSATTDASAVVHDLTAPVVTAVGKPADATYGPGQTLDFTVTFSEAIAVTGTPTLALTVGSTATTAGFVSLADATTATFRYTVPTGAADTDGVALGALALNGGTITDLAGNAANLALGTLPSTAGVRVDGVAPTLGAVAAGSTVEGNTFTFTAAPFTAAYADAQGSPLAALTLVSLPAVGALRFGGVAVESGQSIPIGQLGQLTYVPASGDLGTRTFQVAASDGFSLSAAATVSVQVTPAGTVVNSLVVSGATLSIGVNGEVSLVETSPIPAGARVVGVDLALEYSTYWPPSNPAFAGNTVKLAGAFVPNLGWDSLGNANGWTAVTRSYRGLLPGYVPGTLNTWVFGSAFNPVALRAISLRLYYTAANFAPTLPASSLQLVYETVTPARVGNAVVYSVNRAAELAGLAFSRVHYRMELTAGGVLRYAETSFDPWTGLTLAQLAVPTPAAPAVIQRNVANLAVVSNYPGVVNATGQTGRLELWDRDYFPAADAGIGGSGTTYDFDDQVQTFGAYGSFQVHNLSTVPPQTVFAWNNHGSLAPTNAPETGFGNRPTEHPDWTFAAAGSLGVADWKLRISVETVSIPAGFAFTEDTAGPIRFFGTPFADPDSATLTVTLAVADGTLTAQAGNNVTLGGTATARTFTGAIADLNAYFTTAGRLTYQGALHNTAARTLTVTVSDGALSASTTRPLTFTPVPDAPTLGPVAVAGTEDTPVAFTAATFTGAFADPDGDSLASITVATLPATGTLKLSGTAVLAGQTIPAAQLANLVYEPVAHDHGARTFTVTASDGALSSAAATVTITLAPVNDAPTVTAPATATTAEDTALAFTGPLALAAADIDGDLTTVRLTATNGTVAVSLAGGATIGTGANATATLTLGGTPAQLAAALATTVFTPTPDYHGTATLTVLATDSAAATASATVAVTITSVGEIRAIGLNLTEDIAPVTVSPLDGSTFAPGAAVTAITAPAHGTATFTATTLTYQPAANYHGADSFTYTVTSGGVTETGTVSITVAPVNDAPAVSAPATATTAEDTALAFTGPLALAAADIDGDLATVRLTATNGTVAVSLAGGATIGTGANATATLTLGGTSAQLAAALATAVFTPTPDYHGTATLTVLATDSAAATASATVAVTVTPVADVVADTVTTAEDTALLFNVLGNDTFSSPAAAVTAVGSPAHGTVSFTAAGAVTYTPAADYVGADSFTYTVAAGGVTETATVSVTVTAVNDAPTVAAPAAATTNADTALVFTGAQAISLADIDAAGAPLAVSLAATRGTLTLAGVAGLTFTAGDGTADAAVQFSGSLAALNAALAGLVFDPAPGTHGAAAVTLTVSDLGNTGAGGARTATASVAITVLDTIPPVVTALGSATADGYYKAGAVLDLFVTWSEPVTVDTTGGTPTLRLATTPVERTALYTGGSGTGTLAFRYTVQAGDTAEDLNHAATTALQLAGAVIRDLAGNAAVLTLPATAPGTPGALATVAALVVDTTPPTLVVSGPSVARTSAGPVAYTVTYADPHLLAPTLATGDITLVRTAADARLVAADAAVAVSGTGAARTVTLSAVTGDGELAIVLAAGTAADRAGNLAPAAAVSAAVTVQNTFPVAIVAPPAGADLAVGMPLVTLAVTATGTTPAYQWFRDGDAVPGATRARLDYAATPLAAAGTYFVRVSNILGSVDSGAAAVRVLDVAGTHRPVGPGYVPGQVLTLQHTLTFTGGDGTFRWSLLLPPGWSYVGGEGAGEVRPAAGATDLLEWTWRSFPLSPVAFTAQLRAPAGAAGVQTFAAQASFTRAGLTVPLAVRPDPLAVSPIGLHSGDSDRDGRLQLFELLRVIELFNVRVDGVRTGAYAVSPLGEDGFAPAFDRAPGVVAELAAHHSADTDRDGRLSLVELTRVIELYNFRVGTLRTGQYHRLAGSEDGFAPGPGDSAP